jgi:hypothetical protein
MCRVASFPTRNASAKGARDDAVWAYSSLDCRDNPINKHKLLDFATTDWSDCPVKIVARNKRQSSWSRWCIRTMLRNVGSKTRRLPSRWPVIPEDKGAERDDYGELIGLPLNVSGGGLILQTSVMESLRRLWRSVKAGRPSVLIRVCC